jgi:hypothetical protein
LKREVDSDYSDEAEIKRIKQMAANVFGIVVDKTFKTAAEYNIIGAKSEQTLFSLRLDSLTCFVQDKRFGFNSELGYFSGNDQTQLEIAHNILEKLIIPKSEIAKERIVKEKNQEAEVDRNNMNVIRKSEIGEGKNFVKIYRQIEGNPVWSSNLLLALTKDNRIGFMQLHWPQIPHHTINETHRLRYKLEHGWNVPEEKDYKIESAEAGIIHSPAMSFFMDIYPAIRVIYKPTDKNAGKKKVLYFDRNGKKIPIPRQIETLMDAKYQKRK